MTTLSQTFLELFETVVWEDTIHMVFWPNNEVLAEVQRYIKASPQPRQLGQNINSLTQTLIFQGSTPFPLRDSFPSSSLFSHWYQLLTATVLLYLPSTEVLHRPGWVGRGVAHGTPRHLDSAEPPETVKEAAVPALGRWLLLPAPLFASAGRSRTPRQTGRLQASASRARRATSRSVRSKS